MYKSGQSASGTMNLVTCGFIRRTLSTPPGPEGVPAARMIAMPTRKVFPFKTLNAFALCKITHSMDQRLLVVGDKNAVMVLVFFLTLLLIKQQ
ncbi:hypothetical protein DN752_02535 [Echinicola strongylocentroti]|uniref:Uncharacterized protein n=1 Tax=Echinicola strongylocentroti TaxID=1795355 RepID=A0A2Z4IE47_9BACT|nr:hypothetical protein DN752_02535 [Echinicola strongylocentroti]